MSARDFNKVAPALWGSARFLALDVDARLQFIYYATNPHVNSAGVYRLTDGYAVDDLKCELARYIENRAAMIAAGMVDYDEQHNFLMVERWFKHNPPMNDSHALGTLRFIEAIESDRLREKVMPLFLEADAARLAREAKKKADRELRKMAERLETPCPRSNNPGLLNTRLMSMGGRG